MGKGLELLTFKATAPSSGAAFAALTGNSSTLRLGTKGNPRLVAQFQTRQTAGYTKVTSPLLHDGTTGFGINGIAGVSISLNGQTLTAQDAVSVYGSGSGTAGDIEFWSGLVYYPNVLGVDARLITAQEYRSRAVDLLTQISTLSSGTTGDYSGAELITADGDQFKAATDYAILGATFQAAGHAVRWYGPDTGNLGVGMPAATSGHVRSADWFVFLAELTGLPLIPVISSANKALTYIDCAVDENGTDPICAVNYARLTT